MLYNISDHCDETFFEGIKKIPRGCYATFDLKRSELEIKEWYDIRYDEKFTGKYEDAISIFRDLMENSVDIRLISDVPVGTCLSGGIDSSAIACLINRSMKIKTFSAVYDDFERDESKFISIVAEKTGMANYRIRPTPEKLQKDLLKIIELVGEPFPPPPYMPRIVCRNWPGRMASPWCWTVRAQTNFWRDITIFWVFI